jgi:hypothetical protein
MSERTSKEHPASSRSKGPSDVVAPPDLKAEAIVRGFEGLVHSLGELRVEAMLRAVQESIENQKERTNMPERTLKAAEGLKQVTALHNIKSRLAKEEDTAAKEVSEIREKVKLAELQDFDDDFDKWMND